MTTRADRPALLRGLYAITPGTHDLPRLLRLVGAAIDGGTRLVQYRAKDLPPSERLRQGEALLALCRGRGIPLIVNDDVDLAVALGAEGVHLGRDDGDPRRARDRLPDAILGVSCYDDPSRVAIAAAAGADYAGVGSVFPSATKPGAARAGLGAITEARRRASIPIAAIGGITVAHAAETVAAGADMLAVISALFDAPDVAAAARALSRPFDTEPDRHVRAQPAAV
jgi:thiamine-phosphate pyrophosphorylase